MRLFFRALACVGLCATFAVQAQTGDKANAFRYKWRDGKGLPHYSDSLNAEALKYGYDVIDGRGLTVNHVERQLTPDERVAAKKAADERAAAEQIVQDQHRNDMQMLNAYPSETSFVTARQAEIDNLDLSAKTIRINLQTQEKNLSDLLTRAGDLERARQPVPPYLTERIAEQRTTVSNLRTTLERQRAARDDAQQRADAGLKHYRELRAAEKSDGN
jgi:hypothetical protein